MMRKILQSGLLIFLFSIVYFSDRGMLLQDVMLKSLMVTLSITFLLIVAALLALRRVNNKVTLKLTLTRNSF